LNSFSKEWVVRTCFWLYRKANTGDKIEFMDYHLGPERGYERLLRELSLHKWGYYIVGYSTSEVVIQETIASDHNSRIAKIQSWWDTGPNVPWTGAFVPPIGCDLSLRPVNSEELEKYYGVPGLAPKATAGKVPELGFEVFRTKPINPDSAMSLVRDMCKAQAGARST